MIENRNGGGPPGGEELDEDFPMGDGDASTEATVICPYCSAPVEIALDPGSGSIQEYVEDCEVCCQPWTVNVSYGPTGDATVSVSGLDE